MAQRNTGDEPRVSFGALIFAFLKIALLTFGGYTMLPIVIHEIANKRHWITEEELADYYAIGQATPGIVAINMCTFIGYRCRGNIGGIVATFTFIVPGIVLVSIVAVLLGNFSNEPIVQHALAGVRIAACVLTLNVVIQLARSAITGALPLIICFITLAVSLFTPVSPIVTILCVAIVVTVIQVLRLKLPRSKGGDE